MGKYRLQMALEAAARDTLRSVPWILAAAFATALAITIGQRLWG
ncbi:MAG: hypothetical protein OXK21_08945 [Chloroflexota bacterium]|nr:hypothetical protein [Chloroflexota bacterium]